MNVENLLGQGIKYGVRIGGALLIAEGLGACNAGPVRQPDNTSAATSSAIDQGGQVDKNTICLNPDKPYEPKEGVILDGFGAEHRAVVELLGDSLIASYPDDTVAPPGVQKQQDG